MREMSREKQGSLAGAMGIGVNILLFVIKLMAGLLSGSVAIMADAVNNLTDSGSSIIMLVGFRLAGKPADDVPGRFRPPRRFPLRRGYPGGPVLWEDETLR